jgi:hypothetical protein
MKYSFKYPVGSLVINNNSKSVDEINKYIISEDGVYAEVIRVFLNNNEGEIIPVDELNSDWGSYQVISDKVEYEFKYNISDILKTYEGKFEHYDKLLSYTIMRNMEYATLLMDFSINDEETLENVHVNDLYSYWEDLTLAIKKRNK